jgi:manganese-dependent inorganic pyrophosphatase
VEVVGEGLLERKDELLQALNHARQDKGFQLYALMITDVLQKDTELLVSGDTHQVARAFDTEAQDSTVELPGVMSRKKQVAPKLLAAL